jgi:hypothetical protein
MHNESRAVKRDWRRTSVGPVEVTKVLCCCDESPDLWDVSIPGIPGVRRVRFRRAALTLARAMAGAHRIGATIGDAEAAEILAQWRDRAIARARGAQ